MKHHKRHWYTQPLVIAAVLVLGVGTANALYGPEPGSPDFTVTVLRDPTPKPKPVPGDELTIERLVFDTALGWDFGDRDGYDCAAWEFVDGGTVVLVGRMQNVSFVPGRPANYTEINDRNGREHNDGPNPIPNPNPLPGYEFCPGNGETPDDNADHFPHILAHDAPGSVIVRDPDGVVRATLDLRHAECDPAYWVPGNEAGEAWLWWDDDGPTNDGHGDLDCGGGPLEPEQLVRLSFEILEPGWTVCVPDHLAGEHCDDEMTGPTGPTTPTGPTHHTGPTGPTHHTGPTGPTAPEPVCETHVFFEGTPFEATHTACHE